MTDDSIIKDYLINDNYAELRDFIKYKNLKEIKINCMCQGNPIIPLSNIPILHAAAFYNAYDCFSFLVQYKGCDIFEETANYYTPLHYALAYEAKEVLAFIYWVIDNNPNRRKELQKRIFKNDYTNCTKISLMYCSIIGNSIQDLQQLFSYGYSDLKFKSLNILRETINLCIITGKIEFFKNILDVYTSKINGFDRIPFLILSIQHGFEDGAEMLAGDDEMQFGSFYMVGKYTLLDIACMLTEPSPKIIKIILSHTRDFDNYYSNPAVLSLCRCQNVEIAMMLLNEDIDVNKTSQGVGAMNYLVTWKNEDDAATVLSRLIRKGFNVNTPLPNVSPAACCFQNIGKPRFKLLNILIDNGADLSRTAFRNGFRFDISIKTKLQRLRSLYPEAAAICAKYKL